jgi:dihydroorotate dehydrogenase
VAGVLLRHGVDGVAVSNTTLARGGLTEVAAAREAGGLSGRPLFHRSTVVLARVRRITEGRVPLIGIGGIDSGASAIAKLEAGATLLQLYTGLVYEGPGLLRRMTRDIVALIKREGLGSVSDLIGRRASEWAARDLDA